MKAIKYTAFQHVAEHIMWVSRGRNKIILTPTEMISPLSGIERYYAVRREDVKLALDSIIQASPYGYVIIKAWEVQYRTGHIKSIPFPAGLGRNGDKLFIGCRRFNKRQTKQVVKWAMGVRIAT